MIAKLADYEQAIQQAKQNEWNAEIERSNYELDDSLDPAELLRLHRASPGPHAGRATLRWALEKHKLHGKFVHNVNFGG